MYLNKFFQTCEVPFFAICLQFFSYVVGIFNVFQTIVTNDSLQANVLLYYVKVWDSYFNQYLLDKSNRYEIVYSWDMNYCQLLRVMYEIVYVEVLI